MRTLEGPGTELRLLKLRKRFHSSSDRAFRRQRKKSLWGRLGMTLWMAYWATCIGAGLQFALR